MMPDLYHSLARNLLSARVDYVRDDIGDEIDSLLLGAGFEAYPRPTAAHTS